MPTNKAKHSTEKIKWLKLGWRIEHADQCTKSANISFSNQRTNSLMEREVLKSREISDGLWLMRRPQPGVLMHIYRMNYTYFHNISKEVLCSVADPWILSKGAYIGFSWILYICIFLLVYIFNNFKKFQKFLNKCFK